MKQSEIKKSIAREVRAKQKWAVVGATAYVFHGEKVTIVATRASRVVVLGADRKYRTVALIALRQEPLTADELAAYQAHIARSIDEAR